MLMEGVGSLSSPLTSDSTVADLAWDWRLPTVLVVPVQPGAVGDAIAQIALARQCRIHLKGVVLNMTHTIPNEVTTLKSVGNLIQTLTQVPVLGHLPHLDAADFNGQDFNQRSASKLAHIAFSLDLERLLPALGQCHPI